MKKEEEKIFKSYLRNLLRQLKETQKALNDNDTDKAKELIGQIIDDTQKGVEE